MNAVSKKKYESGMEWIRITITADSGAAASVAPPWAVKMCRLKKMKRPSEGYNSAQPAAQELTYMGNRKLEDRHEHQ